MTDQQMIDIHHLETKIGKMHSDRHECVNLLRTALSAMNNPEGLNEFRTQVVRERIEVCLDILYHSN